MQSVNCTPYSYVPNDIGYKDEGWVVKQVSKDSNVVVLKHRMFTKDVGLALVKELNEAHCVGWKAALHTIKLTLDRKIGESCPMTTKR